MIFIYLIISHMFITNQQNAQPPLFQLAKHCTSIAEPMSLIDSHTGMIFFSGFLFATAEVAFCGVCSHFQLLFQL